MVDGTLLTTTEQRTAHLGKYREGESYRADIEFCQAPVGLGICKDY
jgi:hypothetical protein